MAFLIHVNWDCLQHKFKNHPYSQIATYEGLYKGHQNICSVTMLYIKKENPNLLVAEQKFYLVERNGGWKIIDVDSVVQYKEPKARTI